MRNSWGYISTLEHLPGMCEVIGSVLSTTSKNQKQIKPKIWEIANPFFQSGYIISHADLQSIWVPVCPTLILPPFLNAEDEGQGLRHATKALYHFVIPQSLSAIFILSTLVSVRLCLHAIWEVLCFTWFFKEKHKNWKDIHSGIRLQEDGSSNEHVWGDAPRNTLRSSECLMVGELPTGVAAVSNCQLDRTRIDWKARLWPHLCP